MTVFYTLQVVFGIGLLILVHELGHFLLAKKCGVRVETFAVGFGYRLCGWKRNKAGKMVFSMGPLGLREPGTEDYTDYRISLVPLGGYVKMAGEEPDEALTGADWEFPSKTVGQRASIIVAGVIFNAILAFFVFIFAFQLGVKFTHNEVGFIKTGEAAWEAGLDEGDTVLAMDGEQIQDFDDLATNIAFTDPKKGALFKIQRGSQIFTRRVYPKYNPTMGFQSIGIGIKTSLKIRNIMQLSDKRAPAKLAGLLPEDQLVGLGEWDITSELQLYKLLRSIPSHLFHFYNKKTKKDIFLNLGYFQQTEINTLAIQNLRFKGMTFKSWREFQQIISNHGQETLLLRILRQGKEKTLKIVPAIQPRWVLGIENGSSLLIHNIRYGTLASKYFQKEDVILKLQDTKLRNYGHFIEILSNSRGDLHFQIKRNQKNLSLNIPEKEIKISWIKSNVFWKKGKIDFIRKDSIGSSFFQKGDQILQVNHKVVKTPLDIFKFIEKMTSEELVFTILRDGHTFRSPKLAMRALKTEWVDSGVHFKSTPIIGKVIPSFPAQQKGMLPGDKIIRINDIAIDSWNKMALAIQNSKGESLEIKILRNKKEITFNLHPQYRGVKVEEVKAGSPFQVFQKADRILAVNQRLIHSEVDFRNALKISKTPESEVTLWRNGKKISLKLEGKKFTKLLEKTSLFRLSLRGDAKIGVRPDIARFLKQVPSLKESILLGCKKSYVMVQRILLTLKSVLTAQVSAKNLGGPVLIAQASYSLAQQGLGTLLYFLGLLSLNLAVINILPIPILDGGHLMFLAAEKIKGSKVKEETLIFANYIGLFLLLGLMLFVTYNDIMRLFR